MTIFKIAEASKYLGVSINTLKNLSNDNKIIDKYKEFLRRNKINVYSARDKKRRYIRNASNTM